MTTNDPRIRTRNICIELAILFVVLAGAGILLRLIQSGMVNLPEHFGYVLMTLHGLGMSSVFFLASLVVPLGFFLEEDAGVRLWPWVWQTGRWLFRIGVALLLIATLRGGFAAGWFELYPIFFSPMTTWPWWASVVAQIGIFVVCGSLLFLMIALLSVIFWNIGPLTALSWRRIGSVPTIVLIATVTLIDGIVCIIPGAIFLSFNLWQLWDPSVSFDPLMMKNLVFMFGHTIVNTGMYMAVGGVYAIMPRYSGVPWKTTWYVALAWNGVLLMVPAAFGHHTYMDFANSHIIHYVGQAASFMSMVPLLLVTYIGAFVQGRAIAYRGLRARVIPLLFLGGFMWWLIGGFMAVLDAMIGLNVVFHNTLWVPAHFHTYGLLGYGFFLLGAAWYIFGGNERVGTWAAFAMNIGGAIFVLAFYVAGYAGVPREYAMYDFDKMESLTHLAKTSALMGAIGAGVLLAGFAVLLVAFKKPHKVVTGDYRA